MRSQVVTYALVYVALMVLLAVSVGSTQLGPGQVSPIVNLGLAAVQATLVMWFMMHLSESGGLMRVFAIAGYFWLIIMFVLTLSDLVTRTVEYPPLPEQQGGALLHSPVDGR